jgi:hypothetical protein
MADETRDNDRRLLALIALGAQGSEKAIRKALRDSDAELRD